MSVTSQWRGAFRNSELNALHALCFSQPLEAHDWSQQLRRFSLGWACARHGARLVGFVNLAWDGRKHAFVLDTAVLPEFRQQGIGKGLVELAAGEARRAGCTWLHVDFEGRLEPFYLQGCGFAHTPAGIMRLR